MNAARECQLKGATTIDGASYTVDAVGNRSSKTNQLNSVTENYGYDAIYQLTGATQGANTTESYSYDPVGNRLSSLGVSPYSYNNSNQLTSTPTATYTYDNNGNTLTKVDTSGTTTYAWDFENRLASVTLPGTGGTVSFKYDPFGRRIQKSSAAGTTNYAYDGADVAEEVDAAGSVLARYTMGPGIDQPLAMLRGGTTSYYQADGLGSITSLTDGSGSLAATYTYDAFGKLVASTGTLVNPFRYTARELDSETGLYYYRARYYDPTTGRFLVEDPIAMNGGINFYNYARNNATLFRDPSGLKITVRGKGQQNFDIALMYLAQDPNMGALIRQLLSSETEYTIILNSDHEVSTDMFSNVVYWDPTSARGCSLDETKGAIASPALRLAHELVHVSHSPWQRFLNSMRKDPVYGNIEEKIVIEGLERTVATTLGEGIRRDHGGRRFRVAGPLVKPTCKCDREEQYGTRPTL